MKSLSHVRLSATLWTVGWQVPIFMGFSTQEYWNALPFLSSNSAGQLQYNLWWSAYSLSHSICAYGVFTWAPWAAQKILSPDGEFVEGPWKEVRGWVQGPPHPSLPSSAQEPFQVSSASLWNPSAPTSSPTNFQGLKWDMGTQEPWEDSPAGLGVLWPRLSPGSERFATKSLGWFSPREDPWLLQCPSTEVPMNWRRGGHPMHSCDPLPALHIWRRRRSSEKIKGMFAALAAQPPPPCTDEETMGP